MQYDIILKDITVTYQRHPAVHHVSTHIAGGSLTSLVGPNGSGKTTLLQTIAGLRTPSEGRIIRDGFTPRDIGYLPQQACIDRTFPITVKEFVAAGLWRHTGAHGRLNPRHMQQIEAALGKVGMDGFSQRLIGDLSGGQFQRMLFARLILQDSPVLLLDEPFNALDTRTAAELMSLIEHWHDETRTILMVTHDIDLARSHFPNTLLMARELIACGQTHQVLTQENLQRAHQMFEPFDENSGLCQRGAA